MSAHKANKTEIIQHLQESLDDKVLARRIHRGMDREQLLKLIRGELAVEDLPDLSSVVYRYRIPEVVNAMWDRVRYSVSGCPLVDRTATACFTCPDVQSAACALHNTELLELKLPERSTARSAEKEETEDMAKNDEIEARSLEDWEAALAEDAKEAKSLIQRRLKEVHGMQVAQIYKLAPTAEKRAQLLVQKDTEEGHLGDAPKKVTNGAAKKGANPAAGRPAKGVKGPSKAATASASKSATTGGADTGQILEAIAGLRKDIDNGLRNLRYEVMGRLDRLEHLNSLLAMSDGDAIELGSEMSAADVSATVSGVFETLGAPLEDDDDDQDEARA